MKNYILLMLFILFLSSCIEKKPNFKRFVYHEKTGQYFTFLANKDNWSYIIYMVPYKLEGYEIPKTNYLKFAADHFNLNTFYILGYQPNGTYKMKIFADLETNLLDTNKFKVIPFRGLSDSEVHNAYKEFYKMEYISCSPTLFFGIIHKETPDGYLYTWDERMPTLEEEKAILRLFEKKPEILVRIDYGELTNTDVSKYKIQDAVINNNLPKIMEWNKRKVTNSTIIHKWDACPMKQKFARIKDDATYGVDWSNCEFCQEFAAELESPKNYYSFVRFDSLEQYLWLYCPEKNNLYYSRLNLTDLVKNKKD